MVKLDIQILLETDEIGIKLTQIEVQIFVLVVTVVIVSNVEMKNVLL